MANGWGIDALLTGLPTADQRSAYLTMLRGTGVRMLRERGVNPGYGVLREAGFEVTSFLSLPGLKTERPENQLPEDLLAVFRAAETMAREHPEVMAWEMVGEPDVGYARDLPDRVVAFQKAVYLGIRAGAEDGGRGTEGGGRRTEDGGRGTEGGGRPVVLMGALALPPGPWLERAARNGLLEYTDAYNFHFYGHAEDLTGVIAAHRAAAVRGLSGGGYLLSGLGDPTNNSQPITQNRSASSALPLWITEAGINAVDPDDFLNPVRRQLQADFTIATARQALAAPEVAMFMPFILVHDGDPFAMTTDDGGRRTEDGIARFPAWDAYAKFTREHPWPARVLARPPPNPNPVVVQWLPDPATSTTHKVSGTYRFRGDSPMQGEIRIYNLGAAPVRGRLTAAVPERVRVEGLAALDARRLGSAEIEIPALGRATVPVSITPDPDYYFREDWEPAFVSADGRVSPAFLAFEREPADPDFRAEPLPLQPVPGGRIRFPAFPAYRAGETFGVWTTMNGLRVGPATEAGRAPGGGPAARFHTGAVENDPLEPPMAVAAVEGLPEDGFLRMHLSRPMDRNTRIRVDLVDDAGQRFCIWENFGRSYAQPWADVWLNLRDFGMYFWGRTTSRPAFRPERVREIQLRFYFAQANDPIEVGLAFMRPPSPGPGEAAGRDLPRRAAR